MTTIAAGTVPARSIEPSSPRMTWTARTASGKPPTKPIDQRAAAVKDRFSRCSVASSAASVARVSSTLTTDPPSRPRHRHYRRYCLHPLALGQGCAHFGERAPGVRQPSDPFEPQIGIRVNCTGNC